MKINKILFNKLALQAEEAKLRGMNKLGSSVMDAISSNGSYTPGDIKAYAYKQLEEDVHKDLWKVATRLLHYYDIQSLDIEKLNKIVEASAERFISELEEDLGQQNVVKSKCEPAIPGEE